MKSICHYGFTAAVVVVLMATIAACKTPEQKARAILEDNEASYLKCKNMLEASKADINSSLKALAGGDTSGSQNSLRSARESQEKAQSCFTDVRSKIDQEKAAAGISDEVFAKVWAEWQADLNESNSTP